MNIYQVCVLSALLYGSETRTRLHETGTPLELSSICDAQAYPRRQVALQHHQHWDTVTSIPIMHSLLSQKHLRWLGIRRMDVMDTSPRNNDGQQESRKSDAPLCGSWTLANVTSKCAKLIQTTGKTPEVIVTAGDEQWKKESRNQSRRETSPESWREARLLQKQLYFSLLHKFICAVCRRHWHLRIGLHSFTSTTTDWLERTMFVPRELAFHDNSANAFAILLENSLSTTVFSTNVLKAVNNADTVVMFT